MNRKGFVLMTVLWLLALASVLAGAAVLEGRVERGFSRNRIALQRARWAREACLALYEAYDVRRQRVPDTVDLGRGVWCSLRRIDPGSRININLASLETLEAVFGSARAQALMDWRDPDDAPRPLGAETAWYRAHGRRGPANGPLLGLAEVSSVRGFERVGETALAQVAAVVGSGIVNVNAAPAEVLRTVPGLGDEAVALLVRRRAEGKPPAGPEDFIPQLSNDGRKRLLARYDEFLHAVSFGAMEWSLQVSGGVRGSGVVAAAEHEVVEGGQGLTVIRSAAE